MKYIILTPRDYPLTHYAFDIMDANDSFCIDSMVWMVTLDDKQLLQFKLTHPNLEIYRKM